VSAAVERLFPQEEWREQTACEDKDRENLRSAWNPVEFAREQLRGLVRQVFSPGWPRPSQQVVFSAVTCGTNARALCISVGRILADEAPGRVCVIDAPAEQGSKAEEALRAAPGTALRHTSQQVSENLWAIPSASLLGHGQNLLSETWLRGRLRELRREFDYSVIHAHPVTLRSDTALLGSLADGVVLVLDASLTRRVVAQRTKEILQLADATVLGTVLINRVFPIPDAIYRRLCGNWSWS